MKAAVIHRFGSPDVFSVEEVPKPKVEKPNQVLIEVHCASVNPIDWKTRRGNLKFLLGFKFPKVLGYDVSGIIVEKGEDVHDFNVGDRVFCRLDNRQGGAYAEYAVAGEEVLARVPESMSFETAAAIPLAGLTALQGLRDHGQIEQGNRVFISGGAGGVGYFAVQIAQIMGADVTVVCSDRTMDVVKKLNPNKIYNYKKTDVTQLDDRYDLIFDTVGAYPYNQMSSQLVNGGNYVTTLPRPKVLWHKLIGMFRKHTVTSFLMKSVSEDCEWIADQVTSGKLDVLIDSLYDLDKIADAHSRSESGRAQGKILVRIKNEKST